jgi:hypothetical protein
MAHGLWAHSNEHKVLIVLGSRCMVHGWEARMAWQDQASIGLRHDLCEPLEQAISSSNKGVHCIRHCQTARFLSVTIWHGDRWPDSLVVTDLNHRVSLTSSGTQRRV